VTIRATVMDAQLLAGLRAELLVPATVEYITAQVTAGLNAEQDARPAMLTDLQAARDETRRRLDHLIAAIETGAPVAVVTPRLVEHQAELARLDATLARLTEPLTDRIAIMPALIRQRLEDLVGFLSETPERLKLELQRIGLRVVLEVIRRTPQSFYRATVTLTTPIPGLAGVRDLAGGVRHTRGGADPSPAHMQPIFASNVEQISDRSMPVRSLLR
jgi:hypothetical protein